MNLAVNVVLAVLAGLTTLGVMFGLFALMGLWIIAAAAHERGDLRRGARAAGVGIPHLPVWPGLACS